MKFQKSAEKFENACAASVLLHVQRKFDAATKDRRIDFQNSPDHSRISEKSLELRTNNQLQRTKNLFFMRQTGSAAPNSVF